MSKKRRRRGVSAERALDAVAIVGLPQTSPAPMGLEEPPPWPAMPAPEPAAPPSPEPPAAAAFRRPIERRRCPARNEKQAPKSLFQ